MSSASNTPKSSLRTAGMLLVALAVGAGGTWLAMRHRSAPQVSQGPAGDPIVFYRNPMNPAITSPTFMKDEMGMDYIAVHQSELKGEAGPAVEGLASVKIDPDRQQLIGLTTAPVSEGQVGGEIRTTARVAVDETRIRHIHVKVDGYVEKLFVDFVGAPVAKGKPLFTFFSPDFVAAQEDYLLAVKTQKSLQGGSLQSSGSDLLEASRRRMALWDVPQSEMAQLEKGGVVRKSLTLYSPISGVLTAKTAVEGMRITPADTPFEVTDLGHVWGIADVYEPEIPQVKVGMPAELALSTFPGRTFRGRVAFIDPQVDPKSRTVKVRVDLANPKGELKPEMYGEMVLKSQARKGLTVPIDAVLDSGARKVVFVALGEGRFEPAPTWASRWRSAAGSRPVRSWSPGPTSWWIPNRACGPPWRSSPARSRGPT
jgi:Cu(I)/Ag(I) efflux system membrane fusion protein